MVEATVQVTPRSISNRRNSTFAGPSGSCVENLYNLLHWTSWSIPISAIPVPFKSDVINAQRMITDRVSMKYWKSRVWSSTGMPKIRRRNLVTLFLYDGRHECGEFSWKFHTKLIFARALVTSKKMNQRTINIDLARNRNKHYLWKNVLRSSLGVEQEVLCSPKLISLRIAVHSGRVPNTQRRWDQLFRRHKDHHNQFHRGFPVFLRHSLSTAFLWLIRNKEKWAQVGWSVAEEKILVLLC